MKNSLLLLTISAATILSGTSIFGQTPKGVKYTYTEASDLTITGKLMPGKTTKP